MYVCVCVCSCVCVFWTHHLTLLPTAVRLHGTGLQQHLGAIATATAAWRCCKSILTSVFLAFKWCSAFRWPVCSAWVCVCVCGSHDTLGPTTLQPLWWCLCCCRLPCYALLGFLASSVKCVRAQGRLGIWKFSSHFVLSPLSRGSISMRLQCVILLECVSAFVWRMAC